MTKTWCISFFYAKFYKNTFEKSGSLCLSSLSIQTWKVCYRVYSVCGVQVTQNWKYPSILKYEPSLRPLDYNLVGCRVRFTCVVFNYHITPLQYPCVEELYNNGTPSVLNKWFIRNPLQLVLFLSFGIALQWIAMNLLYSFVSKAYLDNWPW